LRAICTYSTDQLGVLDGDADFELDQLLLEADDDLALDDADELEEATTDDLARFLKLYETAGDNVMANATKARVRLRSLILLNTRMTLNPSPLN